MAIHSSENEYPRDCALRWRDGEPYAKSMGGYNVSKVSKHRRLTRIEVDLYAWTCRLRLVMFDCKECEQIPNEVVQIATKESSVEPF